MNLNAKSLDYIQEVVRVCRLVGVNNVAIEPGMIRGMDDDQKVVIHSTDNVPQEFEFGSIGMSRLDVFQNRIGIAKSQDKFSVEVTSKPDTTYVLSLVMKSKGTKIDFRCTDPQKIRAPKKLNDIMRYEVKINADAVTMLQKAVSAMGADVVTIISNSEGVSFELMDENKDVFKHVFADDAVALDDGTATSFAHRYPVKTLLSLFKEDPTGTFYVGGKGLLLFPVADTNVYVLPQV